MLAEVTTQRVAEPYETAKAMERDRGAGLVAMVEQAMLVVDSYGQIRHCSAGAGKILARSPRSLRGKPLREVMPDLPLGPKTPGYNLVYLIMTYPQGRWHRGEVVTSDGARLRVEISLEPMEIGRQHWVFLELRRYYPSIPCRHDLERLIRGLAGTPEAAMVTDLEGRIEYVNAAYEGLTGYIVDELRGQHPSAILSLHLPQDLELERELALQAGNSHRAIVSGRSRNGGFIYLDETARPFVDRDGRITHHIFIGRDVSSQMLAQEELLQRANFDGLTGLANFYLLKDRLRQEIARARREDSLFAVICVDLDHFKAINDQHGHLAGDAALRVVAKCLTESVRNMDTVARCGGDEFLLILPGVFEPVDLAAVLAKIVGSVRGHEAVADLQVPITLSAGAAVFPADAEDPDTLIHLADLAMYQAKTRGGNASCTWGTALPTPGGAGAYRPHAGRNDLVCVAGGV